MLASFSSTLESHIASQGAYAVFVLLAIGAVLPIASELVMLYGGAVAAGAFAGTNHVSLFGAKVGFGVGAYLVIAVAGTLGYFVGSLAGWWIGRRGIRWLHVTPERLGRAQAWFERWGTVGVLVGGITPFVRSFVAIPAGIFRMRLAPFAALSAVAAAIWAFAIGGVGYALGSNWKRFDHAFKYVEYAIVAGVVILVAYLVYRAARAATVNRRDDPAR